MLTIASMGASGTFGASNIKSMGRSVLGRKIQIYPDELGHIIALTQSITKATLIITQNSAVNCLLQIVAVL